jgi:hypothetical protein
MAGIRQQALLPSVGYGKRWSRAVDSSLMAVIR